MQDVILVMLLCYQPQLLENTIYDVQSPKNFANAIENRVSLQYEHPLSEETPDTLHWRQWKDESGISLLWTFQLHFLLAHPDKVDTKVTWR